MAHRFQRLPTSGTPSDEEDDEALLAPEQIDAGQPQPRRALEEQVREEHRRLRELEAEAAAQAEQRGEVLMAPAPVNADGRREREGWRGGEPGSSRLPAANRLMAVAGALFLVVLLFGAQSGPDAPLRCVEEDRHPPGRARLGDIALLPAPGSGGAEQLLVWAERQLMGFDRCEDGTFRYLKEVSWLRAVAVIDGLAGVPHALVDDDAAAPAGGNQPLTAHGALRLRGAAASNGSGLALAADRVWHDANSSRVRGRDVLLAPPRHDWAGAVGVRAAAGAPAAPARVLDWGRDDAPAVVLEAALDCTGAAGGEGAPAVVREVLANGTGLGAPVEVAGPAGGDGGCPAVVQAHGWWRGAARLHVGRCQNRTADAARHRPWMVLADAEANGRRLGDAEYARHAWALCTLPSGDCEEAPWAADAPAATVRYLEDAGAGRALLTAAPGKCRWWTGPGEPLHTPTEPWALQLCRPECGALCGEGAATAEGGDREFVFRAVERDEGEAEPSVQRYAVRVKGGAASEVEAEAAPQAGVPGRLAVLVRQYMPGGSPDPLSPIGAPFEETIYAAKVTGEAVALLRHV